MRLYERFGDKGYHTSIATTFGIDFDAYESIVLPRLRGAGCRNNIVITDGRMLTHALSGASMLPRQAGKLYTVSGVNAAGVFHPKLFLQLGRRGGRLIVSSANLTASGLAGNLELMEALACDETDSGEQRLIASAWAYAARLIDYTQQGLAGQRDWMQARTPWLGAAHPTPDAVGLSDGTVAALLTTGGPVGIGRQFAEKIDGPVTRLAVISPYWDNDLAALRYLAERLSAAEVCVLLDPERRAFPTQAMGSIHNLQLYERGEFRKGRFIHAKAIIAQTAMGDHILIGSANCSSAALGLEGFAGINEEVCIYRQLPAGSVLPVLGLTDVFTDDRRVDPGTLDPPVPGDDLPLAELGIQSPGQFECRVDTLLWSPENVDNPAVCSIGLLDHDGQPLACALTPLPRDAGGRLRFQISDAQERPSFARVSYPDGRTSAPAIVTLIDHLRAVIRETMSRRTENALRQLDSETEASLALLDVLDVLEKIEMGVAKATDSLSIPKAGKSDDDAPDAAQYRTLSYHDFIAGRRPRSAGAQATHNSLAGTEVAIVRNFLNRIIGLKEESVDDEDGDENALKDAFDLGDETANPEAAIAAGEEFGKNDKEPSDEQRAEAERRRNAAQRKSTKEQILQGVKSFGARTKARQEAGALTSYDILRLRALLMIVCTAAKAAPKPAARDGTSASRLEVLPPEGDPDSWPVVVGRLLFLFFGGKNPAIRDLYLSVDHDQVPDDIIESLATCYWCLQPSCLTPLSNGEHDRITRLLTPPAERAYLLTLPSESELLGDDVMTIMDRMSARYAEKLGIDPAAILEGHETLVHRLFSAPR